MDFNCDQRKDVHFFYTLPFSKNKALIETTWLSDLEDQSLRDYDLQLENYIENNLGIKNYKINFTEKGAIPLFSPSLSNNNKIINIGSAGGMTRLSTGYTFLNIQKQADEYIRMLNGKKFIEYPKTLKNKILRKMDNLLLMIIRDHPSESKKILFEMFNRNKAKRIIRFLSDTPTLVDIISIIWNMPKVIFIKYAIKSFTASKI